MAEEAGHRWRVRRSKELRRRRLFLTLGSQLKERKYNRYANNLGVVTSSTSLTTFEQTECKIQGVFLIGPPLNLLSIPISKKRYKS